MRYWFNENRSEIFASDVEPIDLADCVEINRADYEEYQALSQAAAKPALPREPEPEPGATVDMERLARIWRKMQDKRDQLSHDFKLADLEIQNQQDQVGAALLAMMNTLKGTKLTTAAGVVEKKASMQVSGKDWDAIYRFIKENDAWELLHKRLGSKFVEDWAKTHEGALPPGVSVFTKFVVSVKKPGSKEPGERSEQ